jgi:hypothetical protein
MASVSNADILEDVMKLMNPEDEAEWHRGGLFNESGLSGLKSAHLSHHSSVAQLYRHFTQPFTTSPACPTLLSNVPTKMVWLVHL